MQANKSSTAPVFGVEPEFIQKTLKAFDQFCATHQFSLTIPKIENLNAPGGDYLVELAQLTAQLQNPKLSPDEQKALVLAFQEKFDPNRKIEIFGKAINKLLNDPLSAGVGIGYLYQAIRSTEHLNSISGHASIIVGRRFNKDTKSCEFLIRDSYGPSCIVKDGSSRYELPCENGSVWIEARSLLKNTMQLSWITVTGN